MWKSTTANHLSFTILICTDIKSLFEALLPLNPRTCFIHESSNSNFSSIYIQWIPGHSDIPGDELAEKAANEATTIVTNTILLVSLSSSPQIINDKIRDNPPTHDQVAQIYQHGRVSCNCKQIKNRQNGVLLARLRSGYHPSLHQYLHWLLTAIEPICPSCYLEEQDLTQLALRLSSMWRHKTASVWVPQRVLGVACHLTWGCGGVRKKKLGLPWRLIKNN